MRARRPLFPFLLLNIFVSALVTGTILFFYNKAHPANCNPPVAGLTTVASEDVNVTIAGVIGAGAVQDERVVIQNTGSEKIDLTGWTLSDDKGLAYAFPQSPQLTLYPDASVQVHSRAGTDQPSDVYWNLTEPAWTSGELVVLYDPQHTARAFYRVP